MQLTLHFLFNLSLLIVLLFFGLIRAERTNNLRSVQMTAVAYFIISLLICHVFTYPLSDNILLDLRWIPIMIGGLYMGLGPLLGILTIFIRGFFGFDFGFFSTVIFYGGVTLLCWRISPWFIKRSSKQRILFSVGLTLLFGIFQSIPIEFINGPYLVLDVWLAYLIIQPLGVVMIAVIIEEADKTILLRQHVVKSKRLEAVEQMAAAISHEIRNPLTAANGFVQLLQEESMPKETQVQYLSIIKSELKSADRIIQDYLTFSNPHIQSMEQLNAQEELQNIINLLQPSAHKNSVKIITTFSTIEMIEGDRQKFHQCFINIMKNSIESMPNGGILTVETESTPTNVIIRFQDTGIGMTREQLDRLGEPYYSTKGEMGTGLGITVAYSIIRAMKGTVYVDSTVGKGTMFEFTFLSSSSFNKGILENDKSVVTSS
ncbi:ATP-binding protein [Lederbergia citrea]|uniref:ATP-binding protein n=1 Tax=Lederbergia citrea TaxID=2833581 RepID=UPI001BC97227|nr:ATP-binding protein [Lederbergia citrea]MBS4177469.1 sensor histidine kinase [Lederbergia citrea]